MATLIHSILKILLLPRIMARTSCLLTLTRGPPRSTGTACTIVVQTEKLMSSLVIRFRSPLDVLVKLLLVFSFPGRR